MWERKGAYRVFVVKSEEKRPLGRPRRMWERKGAYRVFVVKSEEKRPLGRPRRRYEDNIKMDRQEWYGRLWSGLI